MAKTPEVTSWSPEEQQQEERKGSRTQIGLGKAVVYWTPEILGKRAGFLVSLRISLRSPSSGSHYGRQRGVQTGSWAIERSLLFLWSLAFESLEVHLGLENNSGLRSQSQEIV
jgi:hypothetical protein